jgi:dihydroorotase-like cyclic amidohydrolase
MSLKAHDLKSSMNMDRLPGLIDVNVALTKASREKVAAATKCAVRGGYTRAVFTSKDSMDQTLLSSKGAVSHATKLFQDVSAS